MDILVHLRIVNPAQPYSKGEFSSKKPTLALKWAASGRRGMREVSELAEEGLWAPAQGNREPCRGRIPTAQGFLPVSAESREGMKGGVGGRK